MSLSWYDREILEICCTPKTVLQIKAALSDCYGDTWLLPALDKLSYLGLLLLLCNYDRNPVWVLLCVTSEKGKQVLEVKR